MGQTTWQPRDLSPGTLFGTDGIRGQVGSFLTAPLALEVGFRTGIALGEGTGPVILGQDSRSSSDMLALALGSGLTAAGLEVWYLGLCPTPGVATITHDSAAVGGVMISASHNPPGDNGIKIFTAQGTKLDSERQGQIEAAMSLPWSADLMPRAWGRWIERSDLVHQYGLSLAASVGCTLGGLRVVLDLAWGAAALVAPEVFRALGAEVIPLHDHPDGGRINVDCGSTHLAPLQQAVVATSANLGFAFDGDADRVLAVDHRGRVVNGDYILYLWANHLYHQGRLPGGRIVSTVMANLGFEQAWVEAGGEFIRTPVGDQHVQAAMLSSGAMLGGEQSGHILCRHYAVSGDGLLTALHLAALVQESGTSLADLVDASFQTYPQLLQNVRVEDQNRRLNWKNCPPLTAKIAEAELALGNQGRVLVRASGTEPLVRVMVEAQQEALATYWAQALVQEVEKHLA